jgi:hypothetical protein
MIMEFAAVTEEYPWELPTQVIESVHVSPAGMEIASLKAKSRNAWVYNAPAVSLQFILDSFSVIYTRIVPA